VHIRNRFILFTQFQSVLSGASTQHKQHRVENYVTVDSLLLFKAAVDEKVASPDAT
jgi:hypothetical protein